MKLIRLMNNTIHQFTGSVRRGDVVSVPDDLAEHWTGQGLAQDAQGAEETHGVPQRQTEDGRWEPDQEEIDRRAASTPPESGGVAAITRNSFGGMSPTVTEPTSGPMTGATGATAPPTPLAPENPEPGTNPTDVVQESPLLQAAPTQQAPAATEPAPANELAATTAPAPAVPESTAPTSPAAEQPAA